MKTRKSPNAMLTPCTKCGQSDPTQFYAGGGSYCKQCHRAAVYQGRLRKYGLTEHEQAQILDKQENRCAICGDEATGERGLHFDHCHSKGNHRAFLCGRCNQTLGRVKDDASLLRAMADYIERYA